MAASNNNTSSFITGTIASELRDKNEDIFGNIILCNQIVEQHETRVGHSPNADTATSTPCPNITKNGRTAFEMEDDPKQWKIVQILVMLGGLV